VQISCADDNLVVTVQDDGIGFDRSERFPGMGLKNMQKRAETLGGQVDIMSSLGQGTQIRLKIPMACMNKEKGD